MHKQTYLRTSNATAKDKEQLYQPHITNVRQAFLLGRLAVANENRTWARKKEHAAQESLRVLNIENDQTAQHELNVRKNATESLQRFYKRSRFAFIAEFPNALSVMETFLPGSTQGITAQTHATKPELDIELPLEIEHKLVQTNSFAQAYYLGRIAAAYESRTWSKQMLSDITNEYTRTKELPDSENTLHTLRANMNARDAIFVSLKRFYKRNRHLAIEQCPDVISHMAVMLPGSEKGLDTPKLQEPKIEDENTFNP